ncbi:hypothetical protein BC834DRAFT_104819 [Gloeopeniophorella convolvens]|nr:hypothetical protein BC834DRAFT_104819 [Gloeopeniophorella convolvens]
MVAQRHAGTLVRAGALTLEFLGALGDDVSCGRPRRHTTTRAEIEYVSVYALRATTIRHDLFSATTGPVPPALRSLDWSDRIATARYRGIRVGEEQRDGSVVAPSTEVYPAGWCCDGSKRELARNTLSIRAGGFYQGLGLREVGGIESPVRMLLMNG